MRLHTMLNETRLHIALQQAKDAGRIAEDVTFTVLAEYPSRTHRHSFEVQLGVDKARPYKPLPVDYVNQYGKRQKTRRTAQGYSGTWAATWHEWGWFIAYLFEHDEQARWGSNPDTAKHPWGYAGHDDFDAKTKWQFGTDEPDDQAQRFTRGPEPSAMTDR